MKTLLRNSFKLALVLIVCTAAGLAQSAGSFFTDEPPAGFPPSVNATTTFRICAASDSGFPCTSVGIFSDKAMTTAITQPVTLSPSNPGSWSFYAVPGVYVRQWNSNISGAAQYWNEFITVAGPNIVELGTYQGTTSVGITDTAFHALIAASSDIRIPAGAANVAGKKLRIHASGVYTNAAASLLNARADICTVSGCATGTDFAAAGCAVVTTNQANNLTNGQFQIDCQITVATTGASATTMAKAVVCANLGATTAVALTCFQDTATAVSAAVDLTVAEFVNISFKFSSSNAGNSATLHDLSVELKN